MEFVVAILILLVFFALLRLVFFRGAIGESVTEPPVGIIDMHCHRQVSERATVVLCFPRLCAGVGNSDCI